MNNCRPPQPHPRLLIPTQFADPRVVLRTGRRKRLRDETQYQVEGRRVLCADGGVQGPPSKRPKLHLSPSAEESTPQQTHQPEIACSSPSPTTPQETSPHTSPRSRASPGATTDVQCSLLRVKDINGRIKQIELTAEKIRSLYHLPQPQAAQSLGIGLSTLKKHARILLPNERWPNPKQRSKLILKRGSAKLKVSFLINNEDLHEKDDSHFWNAVDQIFCHRR